MNKKVLWLVVSGFMALSLVAGACGPAAVEEKRPAPAAQEKQSVTVVEEKKQEVVAEKQAASPDKPRYGGTLRLGESTEPRSHDPLSKSSVDGTILLINQPLWAGDWARGPAGGYGTSETEWDDRSFDNWDLKRGIIAESTKWTVDEAKNEGTIIYQVRQGVHFALNPASEASRLVGGREVTADDLVFHLKRNTTDSKAYVYSSNPELRAAVVTKTGPWEVTVKLPLDALISGISRFGDSTYLMAPEVVAKYPDRENWRNSVGTGPFMLTDYVPGSLITVVRNPNYWEKDPVGPGKGNQLPYLESVQYIIIPDASTRLAALRTGKIDQMESISWEDATQVRKQSQALLLKQLEGGGGLTTVTFRVDMPPFNDIRVRRAMLMALDFKAVHQSVAEGQGRILTRPFAYAKEYKDLYIDFGDPDMPESVKENFSYNPEKAKQLLKEAGYPNGLKVKALVTATQVDSYSIYKFYWEKVGVEVALDVRETGVYNAIIASREQPPIVAPSGNPVGVFYSQPTFSGVSTFNIAQINDPFINEMQAKIRRTAITTGMNEAIKMTRQVTKHILEQAYELPGVGGVSFRPYWPWIKNYSGENSVGYFDRTHWATWVWIDQEMKKSMGY
ncbi:MAG: ABC transporter substrate-binding protein [Chloroflexi bacterium]|nr:ABC transporter substrate-binding protein [Chloroflexota bacterium]